MGFLDGTIAAISNVVDQAGGLVTGNVGSVTGAVETAVGTATGFVGGVAQVPLGALGDIGEVGDDILDFVPMNLIPGGSAQADVIRTGMAGGNWSGGNGQFATRTTVERLEIATGRVSLIRQMPGSPHLMNSDIQAMKRTLKAVSQLSKRVPRKTIRESEVTKLKNAAVQQALANMAAPSCPPKC